MIFLWLAARRGSAWDIPVWRRFRLPQPSPLALSQGWGVRPLPCTGHTCVSRGREPGARLPGLTPFVPTALWDLSKAPRLCPQAVHPPADPLQRIWGTQLRSSLFCSFSSSYKEGKDERVSLCSLQSVSGGGAWSLAHRNQAWACSRTTPFREHLAPALRLVEGRLCIRSDF